MIGAGIFVLLGQAGAIAGSAVWVSFLVAGTIALLTGYSYGRLGARYPSSGGVVEFLIQGYGIGVFSGAVSVLFYLAQVITISMLAVSFGVYSAPLLFGPDASHALVSVLGSGLLVAMTLVLFVYHVFSTAPKTAVALLIFIAAAFIGEFLLQKARHRKIRPRC
jgi:amino acid transporter